MENSFDEQMERYKKQMLHFYKIGKQRSPEPEAVPAVAPLPDPTPPAPDPPSFDPPAPVQQEQPAQQPQEQAIAEEQEPAGEQEAAREQEDLRDPEEIFESDPTTPPERPDVDGITFEAAGDEALESYLRENPKVGFIKMQVFTARGAIPIAGAKVVISRLIGEQPHIFFSSTTDRDGLIAPVPLPAPDRSLSEQPENQGEPVPFATYDIHTEYPRHIPVDNFNVPVFDGIVSIQPVSMTPDTNASPAPEEIYVQEPDL